MEAGAASGRLKLAGLVALFGALAVAAFSLAAGPAGAGDPPQALLPDLKVPTPSELFVERGRDRTLIRFSHTTGNVGDGPLEITPDLEAAECASHNELWFDADQYVYPDANDSGSFERGVDGPPQKRHAGCMFFHAKHDHYHFGDFAEYRLYRESTGRLAATSDKVSFCVFDLEEFGGLPGSERYYLGSSCKQQDGTHGISVGWADVYGAYTPGQELDVTGKRRGRFCLVAEADPLDRLDETNDANNVRRLRIALRPHRGFVKPLPERCKSV